MHPHSSRRPTAPARSRKNSRRTERLSPPRRSFQAPHRSRRIGEPWFGLRRYTANRGTSLKKDINDRAASFPKRRSPSARSVKRCRDVHLGPMTRRVRHTASAPTQSHLVTAHASEATTTWAACAQRRPRYVGQARTVKNFPRSGIGTVKGRARECNRNGPNQGSSSVRAAPDIDKIWTNPPSLTGGDRFARRGVCQPRHIHRNDASVAAVET